MERYTPLGALERCTPLSVVERCNQARPVPRRPPLSPPLSARAPSAGPHPTPWRTFSSTTVQMLSLCSLLTKSALSLMMSGIVCARAQRSGRAGGTLPAGLRAEPSPALLGE